LYGNPKRKIVQNVVAVEAKKKNKKKNKEKAKKTNFNKILLRLR